ncbi:MAG: tetratricopeptide repeat protein [Myxococcales bacterium]|nr:tetratricopeptide repeat protein [Myxococcales bacterium]
MNAARRTAPLRASSLHAWISLAACAALSTATLASACNNGSNNGSSGNGSSGNESRADASTAQATTNTSVSADAGASAAASSDGGTEFRPLTGAQSEEFRRLFAEASEAYGRRDFTAAARSFRALYDHAPSSAMAYNLARVYERMGETADAIQYFQRVLQGQPPPSDAQRRDVEGRIARLRAYEERRAAGIAAAPASQSELNQEGVTWFQRGVRFFQANRFDQALQCFENAARYLQSPELDFNLGMTYERLRQYQRAVEYLRQYLETRRGTPEEEPLSRRIRDLESR